MGAAGSCRKASLAYGVVEADGIRCPYHGDAAAHRRDAPRFCPACAGGLAMATEFWEADERRFYCSCTGVWLDGRDHPYRRGGHGTRTATLSPVPAPSRYTDASNHGRPSSTLPSTSEGWWAPR